MKNILILTSIMLSAQWSFSQVAMDFQGLDCNGNQVHLFSDLDAGKAVAIIYYMPNCGTCPPVAQKVQQMATNINNTYPGMVKAYAFPYNNTTSCSYSSTWVTSNNLSLFTPMDSGALQVAYYGGFGMPTVVLLGGSDHRTMISNQNFVTSDTTIMRDSILNLFGAAGIKSIESSIQGLSVYPNPTTDVINVEFIAGNNSNLMIELINIEGKQMIATASEMVVAGKTKRQINASVIPNGIYTVRIRLNDDIKTETINITH